MTTDSEDLNVCTKCVGDASFSQWIEENGDIGKCDFVESHCQKNKVVTIDKFSQCVDEYFRENYTFGEEYAYFEDDSDRPTYEHYGEEYPNILSNDLECEENVLDAITEKLEDLDDYRPQDGEEPFYDKCSNYESIAEKKQRNEEEWAEHWYEDPFYYSWKEFCDTVKYTRRFFKIQNLLDDLFGDAEDYEKEGLKIIYQINTGQIFHRARLLDNNLNDVKLSTNPGKELSAPPKEIAKSGRMNVEFIPAFYAAFGEDTAIAEVRPSINDKVCIGQFTIQKTIKVFDFTAFDRARENSQPIDFSRYRFIIDMQDEISKPIPNYEKELEYIPTQIVAEYLKEHFGCDAVIYKSSMHKGNGIENRNIVIFNTGVEFIGSPVSPLSFIGYTIKNVENIQYKTTDEDDWLNYL